MREMMILIICASILLSHLIRLRLFSAIHAFFSKNDSGTKVNMLVLIPKAQDKFEQNKDILQILLDTQDNILAECSLMDKKWGIGVAIDDPDCSVPSKWNGKNYLGRILMEVRDELRRLSATGKIGYADAMDADFPLWHSLGGTLLCNPRFYPIIHAYSDTLRNDIERNAFLYRYNLSDWEVAMRINMGGGLPANGFWEMKQDIYETLRT